MSKHLKALVDNDWWWLTAKQQASCARKNCRFCRGKGYFWHECRGGEFTENENVRCKCTRPKAPPPMTHEELMWSLRVRG